ncbi:MAG: CO dehydrogenase/acetyl-CoA synthase complex subunit alpha [Nitrososphaerales archaeon]
MSEDTLALPKDILGPTPFPSLNTFREWDNILLKRYKPNYARLHETCNLCALGRCDFLAERIGKCGITLEAHQARMALLAIVSGAAAHASSARAILLYTIKEYGENRSINLGPNVLLSSPLIMTIVGVRPRTLNDLKRCLEWVQEQIVEVLSSVNVGQEGDVLDLESKALHVGMADLVALEIHELAKLVSYRFPKGEADTPFTNIGFGAIEGSKPAILIIGHDAITGIEVIRYAEKEGVFDSVEVLGLCCNAHEISRERHEAKIIGPLSDQLSFVQTGMMDVIVVDQQCIRVDLLEAAKKVRSPLIATNEHVCYGLPDKTLVHTDEVVKELTERRLDGVVILDPIKAAEVAVKTALEIRSKRERFKVPKEAFSIEFYANWCLKCPQLPCDNSCPNGLKIYSSIQAAKRLNFSKLSELDLMCIGCGMCDAACPANIPIMRMIKYAASWGKSKIRIGRGPIQDSEIREVGPPIILGKIPGVIGFVGCPAFTRSRDEIGKMAEELLKRNYIVVTTGCSAMSMATYTNDREQTLYERFNSLFDEGNLINLGSCAASAHLAGAAVKIANILTHRFLLGNFEEVADYVLNRVGACGIVWGPMAQKVSSTISGLNRLGIPVIMGPRGEGFGRTLLGDTEHEWTVFDARIGDKVYMSMVPEHLLCIAKDMYEALMLTAKLCMRPNDTTKGRQIKLRNYIDFYRRYHDDLPKDIHLFIRTEEDIPLNEKDKVIEKLKEEQWRPNPIPDPTLLRRLVRGNAKIAQEGSRQS